MELNWLERCSIRTRFDVWKFQGFNFLPPFSKKLWVFFPKKNHLDVGLWCGPLEVEKTIFWMAFFPKGLLYILVGNNQQFQRTIIFYGRLTSRGKLRKCVFVTDLCKRLEWQLRTLDIRTLQQSHRFHQPIRYLRNWNWHLNLLWNTTCLEHPVWCYMISSFNPLVTLWRPFMDLQRLLLQSRLLPKTPGATGGADRLAEQVEDLKAKAGSSQTNLLSNIWTYICLFWVSMVKFQAGVTLGFSLLHLFSFKTRCWRIFYDALIILVGCWLVFQFAVFQAFYQSNSVSVDCVWRDLLVLFDAYELTKQKTNICYIYFIYAIYFICFIYCILFILFWASGQKINKINKIKWMVVQQPKGAARLVPIRPLSSTQRHNEKNIDQQVSASTQTAWGWTFWREKSMP